jgi:glycosyltransferase involved in cell wall biosynthesis
MAHDEAPTIAQALRALLGQDVRCAELEAVVVVSSGSRDGTDEIVRSIAADEPRVHLLTQPTRQGKISAGNLFFQSFSADLYVLCNADVILEPGALEALLEPLKDPRVGITGARVVPRVRPWQEGGLFDFANHLLWAIHHRIVLDRPKVGEAVAFRPLVDRIPEAAIADEAFLEATAHERGLEVVYVPEAIAVAGCPLSLADYFSVRRRNYCAHRLLSKNLGYEVTTLSVGPILAALWQLAREHVRCSYSGSPRIARGRAALRDVKLCFWLVGVVTLEVLARGAGLLDVYLSPRRHESWRMARSARRG